jgi:plastocyanin
MFTLRSFSIYSSLALLAFSCGSSDQQDAHAVQQQQPAAVATQTVSIPAGAVGTGSAAYGANPLSVTEGSSVIWTNNDSMAHTATSDTGIFDTGAIQPGASSSPVPFNSPGVFPYHCSIHGAASMSGTIEVVAASPSPSPSVSPTPTPSPTVSPTPTPIPSATATILPIPTSPTKK